MDWRQPPVARAYLAAMLLPAPCVAFLAVEAGVECVALLAGGPEQGDDLLVEGPQAGDVPVGRRPVPLSATRVTGLARYFLYVYAGDGEIADEADDQDRQDQANPGITQPQTTQNRLPKPVGK